MKANQDKCYLLVSGKKSLTNLFPFVLLFQLAAIRVRYKIEIVCQILNTKFNNTKTFEARWCYRMRLIIINL